MGSARKRHLAGRPIVRTLTTGLASAALLAALVPPAIAATPAAQGEPVGVTSAQTQIVKLTDTAGFAPIGKVTVGPVTLHEFAAGKPKKSVQPKKGYWMPAAPSAATPAAPAVPTISASRVTTRSAATGGDGITGTEVRYASPDGARWNFSVEPPDMGLCVGNGYVVQAVNGAVQVSDTKGNELTGVTPLNAFIGWEPYYPDGPGVGDPRCQYDPQTHRFFMSWYVMGGVTVDLGTLIMVSNSSNPLGTWSVYELPDGGDLTLAGCTVSCFPDYPQLGVDGNAVWITNNEFDFGQSPSPYAGVTVWGISKQALVRGTGINARIWGLGYSADTYTSLPVAFTVQPAVTPSGAYDRTAGGTQYFLSTGDMSGTSDNVVNVWAVTNTSAIVSGHGRPIMSAVRLTGQQYACNCATTSPAGGAIQKDGVHPLGTDGISDSIAPGQPLNRLDTNDDRMHQVVYSDGLLWGAAGTVANVKGSTIGATMAVAWWTVRASVSRNGTLSARINSQGYIGAKDAYLWFPAVAVSGGNHGYLAMAFSGPNNYPSVAYAQFGSRASDTTVHIAAAGIAPSDGFSGYAEASRNGTQRWGDYNAAATDEHGRIWFSSEYIGQDGLLPDRAALINWGTYIGVIRPD